jgi:hypothetical protein
MSHQTEDFGDVDDGVFNSGAIHCAKVGIGLGEFGEETPDGSGVFPLNESDQF